MEKAYQLPTEGPYSVLSFQVVKVCSSIFFVKYREPQSRNGRCFVDDSPYITLHSHLRILNGYLKTLVFLDVGSLSCASPSTVVRVFHSFLNEKMMHPKA